MSSLFSPDLTKAQMTQSLSALTNLSAGAIPALWFQNLRAITLAMLLGILSFSVVGMLVLLLPPLVVGFAAVIVGKLGISPFPVIAGLVLPHGLVELPALLIAGAGILNMGAALITPRRDVTIGEAWLLAFADWLKVMVGVVAPLLLLSAVVEALLTPKIALLLFGM
jgi:uncharacterized membrane protein SpoIIM required for sporulation